MESLDNLKVRRKAPTGDEVRSDSTDVRNAAFATDDEETDDDGSFFDLVFESPSRRAVDEAGEAPNKAVENLQSPRDVFMRRNVFSFSKPSSPVTILRSAPKLKVFMFGFRKSLNTDSAASDAGEVRASTLSKFSKLSNSKCRAAEAAVVAPTFCRDNSLRSKMQKESYDYDVVSSRKMFPKYLRLIKPFYVRSSKKTKLTESLTPSSSPMTIPVTLSPRKFSDGSSRIGSFKIVARNLGKSRSATTAMGGAPPQVRRRDDSLLEHNDGIQGAILHCKMSYSSSSREFSQLTRSTSNPWHEKQRAQGRNPCEDLKRCSI